MNPTVEGEASPAYRGLCFQAGSQCCRGSSLPLAAPVELRLCQITGW